MSQSGFDFGPGESGPYHGERAPEKDPRGRRPRHYWRITRTSSDGATPEYWTFIEGRDEQDRYTCEPGWTTDPARAKRFATWNEANNWRKRYQIDTDAITEDMGPAH